MARGREDIRVNAGKPRCEAHSPPTVEGSVSTPQSWRRIQQCARARCWSCPKPCAAAEVPNGSRSVFYATGLGDRANDARNDDIDAGAALYKDDSGHFNHAKLPLDNTVSTRQWHSPAAAAS